MLQVARLAPNLLLEADGSQAASHPVVAFLRGQLNEDGGAKDRSGQSDLYYTVFALEGLVAMRTDPPVDLVRPYLQGFGDGRDLDIIHLTCLARCWATMPSGTLDGNIGGKILRRIESFRSADGGYAATPNAETGTVYHGFLALGAYQDLHATLPNPSGVVRCVQSLQTDDGAFANEPNLKVGTTPATAAAVTLSRHLDMAIPDSVDNWLLNRCHPQGGFLAMPEAPMPDLLSTATALHALSGRHVSIEPVKEKCLDFLDSLWTGTGFCGFWADDVVDCEYTYYALLALGHLSL